MLMLSGDEAIVLFSEDGGKGQSADYTQQHSDGAHIHKLGVTVFA
jgi:hypothetical protein